MSKRSVLMFVVLTMVMSLAGIPANALDLSSLAPFLYQGSNYVPLKSTASFLGAPLRWDTATNQAIMSYNGQDLALTPNSRNATYAGRNVRLSGQTIVVNGVTYVPVDTFKKYYNVPVEWNGTTSQMRIKGANGWQTMTASSRPPWHGGPPPWAPAWGRRGNGTPGHSINMNTNGSRSGKGPTFGQRGYTTQGYTRNSKTYGNGKVKAQGKRRYSTQGNVNSNGSRNGKGQAWSEHANSAQGNQGNGRSNGNRKMNGNGKAKGNNKGN